MVVCVCLLAACNALRVPPAWNTQDEEGWLTEGGAAERGHAVRVALDPPLERMWTYDADGGFGGASPLLNEGSVFVATRHGEVHGIDLATGDGFGHNEFGDAIEGTPVLDGGMLYVPVAWGGRSVQAYNLVGGSVRWKVGDAPVDAGLLLRRGVLIAADVEGVVTAYTALDGAERWKYEASDPAAYRAAPVATADGLIVAADDRGGVVALNASDGTAAWSRSIAAPVESTPAVGAGRIILSTTRGRVVALEAMGGELLWEFVLPDSTVRLTSPAVGDDQIVVGGSDGVLRSLDAGTGAVEWEHEVDGAIAAPPLLTRNSVFVGTMKGRLLGLERNTGRQVWLHEVEGRIKSPMAAKSGHLVVLSEAQLVYVFGEAVDGYATAP